MSQRQVEGHFARKRFGQNFLADERVIERIVSAINPRKNDLMVEIGPGLGALTHTLLPHLDKLTAVELDRDLAERLRVETLTHGKLQLIEADALRFDFSTLATGPNSLRVVGNLPYNISTPLIFHLLEYADLIDDMHFMLQKEVVERMVSAHDEPEYGRLSVMLQYRCEVDYLFTVPPGAFRPPPKVDSAIVRLRPHRQLPLVCHDEKKLLAVVTSAFSMRRKTVRNGLRPFGDDSLLEQAGISPQARPENLSVADYVRFTNLLENR